MKAPSKLVSNEAANLLKASLGYFIDSHEKNQCSEKPPYKTIEKHRSVFPGCCLSKLVTNKAGAPHSADPSRTR